MTPDERKNSHDNWMQLMRSGEFEQAWKISDRVLSQCNEFGSPLLPRHLQLIWNGASLLGKRVLVRCYHGLGDTIQFIRYLPLLRTVASEIIVWAQPAMLPLLKGIKEIDVLLELHDGTPEIQYDIDIEIMESPHIFQTTLETIPVSIPLLHLPSHRPFATDQRLKVGLVWQAGNWLGERSIPFSYLAPFAKIPGIELFILQQNAAAAGWKEGFGIHPGEFSLFEYARRLLSLDLLITVDSMPAHLAGTLGIPVWTLLISDCDWRWMADRADSPWYPSMRLFRQHVPGNWQDVIERVIAELSSHVQSGTKLNYSLMKIEATPEINSPGLSLRS